MDADRCRFAGDSDLYGLGIRIGVYAQLLSTLITNHFLPAAMAGNSTANLIFLWALLLAVARSASQTTTFFAVEAFVILQLILMFFFAGTTGLPFVAAEFATAFLDGHIPVAVLRRLAEQESLGGLHLSRYLSQLGQAYTDTTPLRASFQRVLAVAASALNFWFWVAGVRGLKRAPPGCLTYVFLFAPVEVAEPVRAVFILLSSVYLAHHGVVFLFNILPSGSWREWIRETFDPRSKSERGSPEDDANEGVLGHTRQMRRSALSARLLRYLHTALLGWSLCVMAYSILAVELTLAWNHVEGVYEVVSTGQFIPLLIGILGLGRAVVSAVTEHRVPLRGSAIEISTMRKDDSSATFQYRLRRHRKRIVFDAHRPSRRHSLSDLNPDRPAPMLKKTSPRNPLAPVMPVRPSDSAKVARETPRVEWTTARVVGVDRAGHHHIFHEHHLLRRASWDGATALAFQSGAPHRARQALWTPLAQREQAQKAEERREGWFERAKGRLRRQVAASSPDAVAQRRALDEQWGRFRDGTDDEFAEFRYDYSGNPVWLPPDVDDQQLFFHRPRRRRWSLSVLSSPSTCSTCSIPRSLAALLPSSRGSSPMGSVRSSQVSPASSERRGSVHSLFDRFAGGGSAPCLLQREQNGDAMTRALGSSLVERKLDQDADTRSVYSVIDRSESGSIYIAESFTSGGSSARGRARSTSRSSNSSWSRHSSTARDEWKAMPSGTKIVAIIILPIITMFNALCLCGLCVGCRKGGRKLRRDLEDGRFERARNRRPPIAPTWQRSMLYQCAICDRDFSQERRTRQWQRIRPNAAPKRARSVESGWIGGTRRHLLGLIRPKYTKDALTAVIKAVLSLLGKLDIGQEIARALKARIAAYELEDEGVLSYAWEEAKTV